MQATNNIFVTTDVLLNNNNDLLFVANNNIVSQSVAHLHLHVVPRTRGDGLRGFFWPRNPYDDDQHRDRIGAQLRAAYEATFGG